VAFDVEFPEFPSSRNLALENKSLLDSLLKHMQPTISELTFTNLFAWNGSEPVQISRLGETVLLQRRRLRDGKTFLLPPLGEQPLTSVVRSLRASRTMGSQVSFYGMVPEQVPQLGGEGVKVETDRDDWDYVYLTSDLAGLPGDKYHAKRNFISRCLSKYECKYVSIGPSEVKNCLELQTEWCNLRNCSMVAGLETENTAIKTVFDHFEYLGVFGGAVYVDDKVEAFTLAELLNDETAVIHFEKANPRIEGLYQVINQWFCQKALRGFRFVNREQDLGMSGLRKAKQSYHPHHMVEKSIVHLV
jgi:hypothetical protein